MSNATVNWHPQAFMVAVNRAEAGLARKVANAIVARAKLNIRQNNQIDTGFMLNSIYTIWPGGSNFSQASDATSKSVVSSKTGDRVDHTGDLAPQSSLEQDVLAEVAVGAIYAIYQEAKKPFLWPAAQEVATLVGGEAIKKEFRDVGL